MSNAEDTVDTSAKTVRRRRTAVETETPIATAQRRWADENKEAVKRNKVTDTWYEVSQGHKLVLCKRRASGSVFRTLIGSKNDKDYGPSITAKIAELEKSRQIKLRF